MGMFDYFVASLECPKCGHVSPADHTTLMQTKALRDPGTRPFGVGDRFKIEYRMMIGANYICMVEPSQSEPIRVVQQWYCARCQSDRNWVLIEIADGVIRMFTPVDANAETIRSAHYVEDTIVNEVDHDETESLADELVKRRDAQNREWQAG